MGVIFGSAATYCIMKNRKSFEEHHSSPADGACGEPLYEQVLPLSNTTLKEEHKMDKNVAYGHNNIIQQHCLQ